MTDLRALKVCFLSLFFFLLCVSMVNAFDFTLTPNKMRCFTEELVPQTLVKGAYDVLSNEAPGSTLDVLVHDFLGQTVWGHSKDLKGKFAFTAARGGDYTFCFTSIQNGDPQGNVVVSFDLASGIKAMDYHAVAKKEHLKPLDLELRKLEDMGKEILKDMDYLRQREGELRVINESINNRVSWISYISIIVLISLGSFQVWFLRRFFHQKKIIP
eukprot:TRINITY_DN1854_c0_g1_i1.p1 TRINITY_DN1854_c0_g1~~TRINITY_DN1854_c0_g1_i1.p1  ORF type:complete len:214 (-),score=34.28 TRINITY_DN1854_c0_g1_i1:91-732(-)